MASQVAVNPKEIQPTTDSPSQEIAKDYSNQWHILEQLKSSVAVVDNQNQSHHTTLTPQNSSKVERDKDVNDEDKADKNDWYLLPEACSSGHSSETEADSALDISDLKNNADISYNSNTSASRKTGSKEHLNKELLYQEQWHVLEELKASVKAMQWGSDSSLDISRQQQESPKRSSSKGSNFVEPHMRSPAGNLNVTTGSIGNAAGCRDTSKRSELFSNQQSNGSHAASPPGMQTSHETSGNSKNTSSDLSLESENLVFAELPNRPATIGNYGASDVSTYPMNGVPVQQQQPFNINLVGTQDNTTSQYHGNNVPLMTSPLFFLPEYTNDGILTKSPMSARERLQPDGRDGPDLMAIPAQGQALPGLVSYPLSAGSSQFSSGNSSNTLSGRSGYSSVNGLGNLSAAIVLDTNTSNLTVETDNATSSYQADQPIDSIYDHNGSLKNGSKLSQDEFVSSATGSQMNYSDGMHPTVVQNDLMHLNESQTPTNEHATNGSQLTTFDNNGSNQSGSQQTPYNLNESKQLHHQSGTRQNNDPCGLVNNDDNEVSASLPSQSDSCCNGLPKDTSSLTWLSSRGSVIESNDSVGHQSSLTHEELREAVLQRIEAHTEIPGLKKDNLGAICCDLKSDSESFDSKIQHIQNELSSFNDQQSQHEIPSKALSENHSNISNNQSDKSHRTSCADSALEEQVASTSANSRTNSFSLSHQSNLKTEEQFQPHNNETGSVSSAVPKPSVLENLKKSVIHNTDYEQSPVSKLLGPNFIATQDYLNKLKTERLCDSSGAESLPSSGRNSQESTTIRRPANNSSENSLIYDKSFQARKEAWTERNTSFKPTDTVGFKASHSRDKNSLQSKEEDNSTVMPAEYQPFDREDQQTSMQLNETNFSFTSHQSLAMMDTKSKDIQVISRSDLEDSLSKNPLSSNKYYIVPKTSHEPLETGAVSDNGYGPQSTAKELSIRESNLCTYDTPLTSISDKKPLGMGTRNLRYSGSSFKSRDDAEDTDDLLSYEAALEGDIKYFKNIRDNPQNSHFHSSSISSKTEGLTPSHLTRDISAINGSIGRDPLQRNPVSVSSTDIVFTHSDEATKQYHLSLGAGEVRPVVGYPRQGECGHAELSSDVIEDDDKEEGYSSERETTPATESSCSSLYQPYLPIALRQSKTERESTVNSSSTYGVYDIRHSSGPGSTNRRRRAMGLSPIPGRVSKPGNGVVYVSGNSSPFSIDEASADERSMQYKVSSTETSKDTTKASLEGSLKSSTSTLQSSENSRTSSRNSHKLRHQEDKRPRSSSKEGGYRSRSRGSSSEEAKMIDDYIGGRKAIPQGKQTRSKSSRRHTDDSSRDFQPKSTDLNQMWERFQESLKMSPRSKSEDSVSSHLSRLSALLLKPVDTATTSSDAESDNFRKPRSHSYASSSSDLSTESEQPYNHQNYSLTRQIQLRKLLETVNIADVPTFPRVRHKDTTSATMSDTSTQSDAPEVHYSLPRPHKGSRKVSKTPSLEPFVKTKSRPMEIVSKPKCICAIKDFEPKPLKEKTERKKPIDGEKKTQLPQTFDVGISVPTPKQKRMTKSKVYVDVGVQTKKEEDDESLINGQFQNVKQKASHSVQTEVDKTRWLHEERHLSNHKERHLASHNSPSNHEIRKSPVKKKERYIASQNITPDTTRSSDESLLDESKEKLNRSRHRRERMTSLSESKHNKSQYKEETNSPSWFYPISNRHYSRPSQHSTIQQSRLRYDEPAINTFSPPAAAPSSSMQKLSLQDAFFFAKPDFVKRSRARLSRIERNKNVRENGDVVASGEDRVTKMEIPASKPMKPLQAPKTEKLNRPKPRQFTKKEMKSLNLKLYNNLPEVKAKKADDRRANFYKSNRLRAKLFDKRVRESLKKRYAA